jgi:hypothetical protein
VHGRLNILGEFLQYLVDVVRHMRELLQ